MSGSPFNYLPQPGETVWLPDNAGMVVCQEVKVNHFKAPTVNGQVTFRFYLSADEFRRMRAAGVALPTGDDEVAAADAEREVNVHAEHLQQIAEVLGMPFAPGRRVVERVRELVASLADLAGDREELQDIKTYLWGPGDRILVRGGALRNIKYLLKEGRKHSSQPVGLRSDYEDDVTEAQAVFDQSPSTRNSQDLQDAKAALQRHFPYPADDPRSEDYSPPVNMMGVPDGIHWEGPEGEWPYDDPDVEHDC